MEWIGWVHSGGEGSILQYIGAPSRGQPLILGESTKLGYIVGKGVQGGGVHPPPWETQNKGRGTH